MNLEQYLPLIEFTKANNEEAFQLAKLANSVIEKLAIEPESDFKKSKELSILEDSITLTFKSNEKLGFFYALSFIERECNEKKNYEDWETFFKIHLAHNNQKLVPIYGYGYDDLFFLIIISIYDVDLIPYLTSNDKMVRRIVRNSFVELSPYIDTHNESLVEGFILATEDITAEGNYFNVNDAVQKLSNCNPDFGWLLLNRCDDERKRKLFIPHLYFGLTQKIGFTQTKTIIDQLFISEKIENINLGLWCLRMLSYDKEISKANEAEIIQKLNLIPNEIFDDLNAELIYAYSFFIKSFSTSKDKIDNLSNGNLTGNIAFRLSQLVFMNSEEFEYDNWYFQILKKINNVHSHPIGCYHYIEMTLIHILKVNQDYVFEFLTNFLNYENCNPKNIEGFKNLFEEIGQNDLVLLQKWITIWLNNDNPNFQIAVSLIVNQLWVSGIKNIELDGEILNSYFLGDVEYILYKINGYIPMRENIQELSYSITKYEGIGFQHIGKTFAELFCYHILYDYPSSIDFIKAKKSTATEKQVAIIEAIERYYDNYNSRRGEKPKELEASPKRLRTLFNESNKNLNSGHREEKFKVRSFLDMVTTIDIKNGSSFISRLSTAKETFEIIGSRGKMNSFGTSFEMPNSSITDPIGNEYNRHIWRRFKRRKI